jgi:hypothetical protein
MLYGNAEILSSTSRLKPQHERNTLTEGRRRLLVAGPDLHELMHTQECPLKKETEWFSN